MNYTFQIEDPHKHFIHIIAEIDVEPNTQIDIQLPSWRPGRYELANFAKNIKDFTVKDSNGMDLKFHKVTKDRWQVFNKENNKIQISYLYYASELNAGSTFLDEDQLYVNPINCCVYIPEKITESCSIRLEIPKDYKIVTSLKEQASNLLVATDFHELVDSPIIASSSIQSKTYSSHGVNFHICFQGEIKVDWKRIINDFQMFTDYQIVKFGSFPVKEYYFLFQITPYTSYHGVEHHRSTVILLGPSYKVFNERYRNLLGICSHELYHTWNVKGIRPDDMLPYDYSKENYSELGYVAEGVTTYMGDRMLFESGVFLLDDYFRELMTLLERHFHNDGRKHYSVAESSFDTWLDGYVPGVPGRKVSIYVEGALIAFICDAMIRRSTDNKSTLHDVMREFYSGGDEITGYDELLYKKKLEEISGISFDDVFDDLIHGKVDFFNYLGDAMEVFGWKIMKRTSIRSSWNYGFKSVLQNNMYKVINVIECSSADNSGLIYEDNIHSVNGFKLENNLENWLTYFKDDEIILSVERAGVLKRILLEDVNEFQCWNYKIEKLI